MTISTSSYDKDYIKTLVWGHPAKYLTHSGQSHLLSLIFPHLHHQFHLTWAPDPCMYHSILARSKTSLITHLNLLTQSTLPEANLVSSLSKKIEINKTWTWTLAILFRNLLSVLEEALNLFKAFPSTGDETFNNRALFQLLYSLAFIFQILMIWHLSLRQWLSIFDAHWNTLRRS